MYDRPSLKAPISSSGPLELSHNFSFNLLSFTSLLSINIPFLSSCVFVFLAVGKSVVMHSIAFDSAGEEKGRGLRP